jgi:hypothetical protein
VRRKTGKYQAVPETVGEIVLSSLRRLSRVGRPQGGLSGDIRREVVSAGVVLTPFWSEPLWQDQFGTSE